MTRTVGIEVEGICNLSVAKIASKLEVETGIEVSTSSWSRSSASLPVWHVTTDGSIRDSEGNKVGKEIVSPPLPINEKSFKELKSLLAAARNKRLFGKNYLRIDRQCSVHVHISREELDRFDVEKVYHLYAYIEPELNKMLPDSRRNNKGRGGKSYCAPISDLPFAKAFEKDPEDPEFRELKYYSVQFPFNIPTIEFRVHGATTNAKKIWNWVRILNEIMDFAVGLPVTEVWDDELLETCTLNKILSKEMYEYYLERAQKLSKTKS